MRSLYLKNLPPPYIIPFYDINILKSALTYCTHYVTDYDFSYLTINQKKVLI